MSQPYDVEVGYDRKSVDSFGQMQLQEQSQSDWSWCSLIWSMVSIYCCCPLGIVATVISVLAYLDHVVRDRRGARTKLRVAWSLVLVSLILGLFWICFLLIFRFAFPFKWRDMWLEIKANTPYSPT